MINLIKQLSLLAIAPLIGIGIALFFNWAKDSPIYQGDDAILAVGITLLLIGASSLFIGQKLIIWRARERIKKQLSGAIRRSNSVK